MAIVGLGVVTLLEIFSLGLRLGGRSFERTEAIAYGQQAMDEVLIRRGVKEGGEGVSLVGDRRWRVQVKPLREETGLLSSTGWELEEITLKIRYRDGGRERQIEMSTLRLAKKKSP